VADVGAALGAGLSAGVDLAFSTFVRPGLRKLPPAHAISAMSSNSKTAPGQPAADAGCCSAPASCACG
jgi:uncharacterized membrane protein